MLCGVLRFTGRLRLRLKYDFTLPRQLHLFARNLFDRRWIALQRLHAILHPLIFIIQPLDVFPDFLGFPLGLPHSQDAMRPEDIL